MKINLNIIKILCLSLFFSSLNAAVWVDVCQTCDGCKSIKDTIKNAADDIDDRHEELEKNIKKKYQEKIIDNNLADINKTQVGITKSVARIRAMEHEADLDSKHLIFLLKKNKELYTMPQGVEK